MSLGMTLVSKLRFDAQCFRHLPGSVCPEVDEDESVIILDAAFFVNDDWTEELVGFTLVSLCVV